MKKRKPKYFRLQNLIISIIVVAVAAIGVWALASSHADSNNTYNLNAPPVGIASAGSDTGYWIAASDGGVFAQGTAVFHGSLGGDHLSAPIVAIAPTPDYGGYYLLGSDGAVYAFGDAHYEGGLNGGSGYGVIAHSGTAVGIAAYAYGGYWIITSTGETWGFDGAPNYGNVNGSSGVVGIASDFSYIGYFVVSNTSQTYNFGGAGFCGNVPGISDIVAITGGGSHQGCWQAGADGGVFATGVPFFGSMGGQHLNAPIVGIAHTGDDQGYWLLASDGGVFAFGDAQFEGRVEYSPPTSAITTNFPNILAGQKSTINWGTTNATSVSITNIGPVNPAGGTVTVAPTVTTTYVLSASGPGGTSSSSVTINVTQPPPPPKSSGSGGGSGGSSSGGGGSTSTASGGGGSGSSGSGNPTGCLIPQLVGGQGCLIPSVTSSTNVNTAKHANTVPTGTTYIHPQPLCQPDQHQIGIC